MKIPDEKENRPPSWFYQDPHIRSVEYKKWIDISMHCDACWLWYPNIQIFTEQGNLCGWNCGQNWHTVLSSPSPKDGSWHQGLEYRARKNINPYKQGDDARADCWHCWFQVTPPPDGSVYQFQISWTLISPRCCLFLRKYCWIQCHITIWFFNPPI